jgi:hypothetical protein
MRIDFFTYYIPGFSCNLCNLKKYSDITSFDKKSPFRGVKKVTQVTRIFWCILSPFFKIKRTMQASLLVSWDTSEWSGDSKLPNKSEK